MTRIFLCCFLLPFIFTTGVRSQTARPSEQMQTKGNSKNSQPEAQASKTAPDPKPSRAESSQSSQSKAPDSTKLQAIKVVKPVYPEEARQKQIQGQVLIKLTISETGDVEKTEIVKGDPILGKAAQDAFKRWKFNPYIRDGKPVKVSTTLPYDFAFKSNVTDIPATGNTLNNSPANETKTVSSAQTPLLPESESSGVQILRISSDVSRGLLLHKVNPVYPEDARQARIQGTVVLRATIGKDGQIANLTAISGNSKLIPATLSAVQQWRYRPYLLNGRPVAVSTQITVNFQLVER